MRKLSQDVLSVLVIMLIVVGSTLLSGQTAKAGQAPGILPPAPGEMVAKNIGALHLPEMRYRKQTEVRRDAYPKIVPLKVDWLLTADTALRSV